MTTITIERAFLIKVLNQIDIAQSLLERSQHHAKMAAVYEELRAALAAPATAPEISTATAVGILCKSLREDLDYAWSWHCNIAMTAFDAGCPHDVANEGAARFMQLLADVDTRKHPGFQVTQDYPMWNPATASEPSESVVWKATSISGDTAHFGVRSAAKAWARSGTVEAVPIKNLRLVPKPDAPCKTCESLARAVMMDQFSNDCAPSWHDAPTVPGVWLCNYGGLSVATINQPDVDGFDLLRNAGGRWYGPIPEDKP